jgi:hypothetical protein
MLAATMIVLPLISIAVQTGLAQHLAPSITVILRWFVFWAVGVQLLMAGLRQVVQPRYTAEVIVGLKGADATMTSDLFAALVLLGLGIGTLVVGHTATR